MEKSPKNNSFKYTNLQLLMIYVSAVTLGICLTMLFATTTGGEKTVSNTFPILGLAFSGMISFVSGKSIYEMIKISKQKK